MLFKRKKTCKTYDCSTCGYRFEPEKERLYIAKTIGTGMMLSGDEYNAMDCPRCGCQVLLSKHYARQITEMGIECKKEG